MAAKKPKYQSSFQKTFTDIPHIASSSKGNSFARCTACSSDFSVSHGGKADITKHINTQKHIDSVRCIEKNQKLNFSVETIDQRVINAECLFSSFLLEHNLPLSASDHAGSLFKKMFPDSQIVKKYACARTKTTAIVKEIASQSKSDVLNFLQSTPFAISTDGSNNTDAKIYPIVVTFFNSNSSEIEHKLISLPVLKADSTGVNIAQLIISKMQEDKIPMSNCLALSADNAPVMVGVKKGVGVNLQKEIPDLYVMGCLCHLINLAAEKGAGSLPFIVDEYLLDIFYYLEKSCKRKEKLKKFQEMHNTEVRKILKHVCTRWLSLGKCLTRVIDQWNPLLSFFKEEVNASNIKIPSSLQSYKIPKLKKIPKNCEGEGESVETVNEGKKKIALGKHEEVEASTSRKTSKLTVKRKKSDSQTCQKFSKGCYKSSEILSREERIFMFLSSDLNRAFCLFLRFALPIFDVPNTTLQSRMPLIHVLYSILSDMYKNILSKFVKASVILSSDSVFKVDYHNADNQKQDEDLVVGAATTKLLQEIPEKDRKTFYFHVRQYFAKICDYILNKFPVNDQVIIRAKVANVSLLADASFSDVKYFLNRFPTLVKLVFGDSDFDTSVDLLETQFCSLQLEDLEEIKKIQRIDTQWKLIGEMKSISGAVKYKELSTVILSILTIPHSNAECERIFSMVNKTRNKFRPNATDETLEKLLIAKINLQGFCHEQKFQPSFLKKAKSATMNSNLS